MTGGQGCRQRADSRPTAVAGEGACPPTADLRPVVSATEPPYIGTARFGTGFVYTIASPRRPLLKFPLPAMAGLHWPRLARIV
jgi:hypothetical protein